MNQRGLPGAFLGLGCSSTLQAFSPSSRPRAGTWLWSIHESPTASPAPNQIRSPRASQWRGNPSIPLTLFTYSEAWIPLPFSPCWPGPLLLSGRPHFSCQTLSLRIPHDDFQPWLLPVEHMEPGTPLSEGDKGDKAGQETGDGAGKAEETPPGSRICRLSFLLHGLGLNPHIPMGTLSQWGPRGSVGTPHPHWSRGGPGFSPGQGL